MKSILSGETNAVPINFTLTLDSDYMVEDIKITKPIIVSGEVINYGGYMELRIKAEADYETECARCLDIIKGTLTVEFNKSVTAAGTLSDENTDIDDYVFIVDGMLDVSVALAEQILLEYPLKQLCRDDCKGLCPKCGRNLNESECGCAVKEIDPRLEGLKKLLGE